MTDKNYVRFERGERVDQPDLQHVAEVSHRDALAQLVEEVILGRDGSPVVLWGFEVSGSSPNITVTRGAAITGFRDRGQLYRAMVIAGGPASKTYNVSTLPDGAYGIYVRLAMRPSSVKNRRFWNATGAPAAEETRLVATRIVEDWDIVLERASPGQDYLQFRSVTISGGAFVGISSFASRMFDSMRSNRRYEDADWGGVYNGVSDRDETDGIGLRGFERWVKMVGRQLQDIIDADFFGSDPQGGNTNGTGPRSLSQLNSEKLARNGAQTMQGNINPDANNTRSLGTSAAAFATIWGAMLRGDQLTLGERLLDDAIEASDNPRSRANFREDGTVKTWIWTSAGASTGVGEVNVYRSLQSSPAFELAVNARWLRASSAWHQQDASRDSMRIRLDANGLTLQYQSAGAADWGDGAWIGSISTFQGAFNFSGGMLATNVTASGNFLFQPARTFRRAIPGTSAVIPEGATGTRIFDGDLTDPTVGNAYAQFESGSAGKCLHVPLSLPHGATLAGVQLHGTFTPGAGQIRAAVVRQHNTTGVRTSMNSSSYETIPSSGGSIVGHSLTLDQNQAIDNDTYSYYVWIGANSASSPVEMALMGVEVTYSLGSVVLP